MAFFHATPELDACGVDARWQQIVDSIGIVDTACITSGPRLGPMRMSMGCVSTCTTLPLCVAIVGATATRQLLWSSCWPRANAIRGASPRPRPSSRPRPRSNAWVWRHVIMHGVGSAWGSAGAKASVAGPEPCHGPGVLACGRH